MSMVAFKPHPQSSFLIAIMKVGEGGGGNKEKWGKCAKSKALSRLHTGKGQPVHPKLNPKMNRIEYLKQLSIECKQCFGEEGFV